MAEPVGWGVVSTADINRKVFPGAHASPKVELVAVASRELGRAEAYACEWSIRALESGKHVLCEKPLSRHPEEVAAAFDAAERNGRVLMEAFMYRHHPQTARPVELVRAGAIGELRLVRSAFSYALFDETNIRLRTEVEGGALMGVGCYKVSGSRLLAGEPERGYGGAWV